MLKYTHLAETVLFVLALIASETVFSQEIRPGGVEGVYLWEMAGIDKNGDGYWKSRLNDNTVSHLFFRRGTGSINNNPALIFSEGVSSINKTINIGNLESFSLFTVCQERDTISEGVILTLENDSVTETVLTNRRMAALDIYRYANYDNDQRSYPKIYSYTQNRSGLSKSRLFFGMPPKNQDLPVSAYNGYIPEIILFTRHVSPIERQKVESYLALKYGISLNQEFPSSYLNSYGEIIWDSEINSAFNHNIAGIGRDDLSGLYQNRSESIQSPGAMTIEALNGLRNNSYMIWGDNGSPLRFEDKPVQRRLLREWKISAFNIKSDSVSVETSMMALNEIDPLIGNELCWLMIDRSGTGKYPFRQTSYIRGELMLPGQEIVRFSPVVIDDDNSGSDLYTLLAAPPFFARTILRSPACDMIQSGVIMVEIAGGQPPFNILLSRVNSDFSKIFAGYGGRDLLFEEISQGRYLLRVTDAAMNSYCEEIWVSNGHTWETSVETRYNLLQGETIFIDASDGMPELDFDYSWLLPDGEYTNSADIAITQPGTYLLSVTDNNNCNSTIEVDVSEASRSNFRKIELYPNPVNGIFFIRMRLERRADVILTITDLSGNLLRKRLFRNDLYYQFSDIIEKPGSYLISLSSGNELETLKLIVQ